MTDVGAAEELSLPTPDLPSNSAFVRPYSDNNCEDHFISLSTQSPKLDIRIIENLCSGNTKLILKRKQETELCYENNTRIVQTFQGWPLRFLDPEVLAEAGFVFTGLGDTIRCSGCGGELSNWQPGDDPRLEHLKKFGFKCN